MHVHIQLYIYYYSFYNKPIKSICKNIRLHEDNRIDSVRLYFIFKRTPEHFLTPNHFYQLRINFSKKHKYYMHVYFYIIFNRIIFLCFERFSKKNILKI